MPTESSNSAKAYYRRRHENYEDSLISLTKAFDGNIEKAKEYWEWGSKVCDSSKMIEEYGHLLDQPELLRKTARSELLKHGMTYAPYQNIVGVQYQEPDNLRK